MSAIVAESGLKYRPFFIRLLLPRSHSLLLKKVNFDR
jgi:hypothetical protein